MSSPRYLVDTNVILGRTIYRAYDEILFPRYWENFDKLVNEGIIISTESVNKEIMDLVKKQEVDDKILAWAKDHSQMFKFPLDEKYTDETKIIKNQFPGWYNKNKLKADLNLVVFAKAYNLILVTQETPNFTQKKQNKYKIPTVCKKLGAYCRCGWEVTSDIDPSQASFQCINFVELVRRERLDQE